jgi:hypothetical protein
VRGLFAHSTWIRVDPDTEPLSQASCAVYVALFPPIASWRRGVVAPWRRAALWCFVLRPGVLCRDRGFDCDGQIRAGPELTRDTAHISAQSSVALTATGAASYLIVCVPIFEIIGVRAMGLGGEYGGRLFAHSPQTHAPTHPVVVKAQRAVLTIPTVLRLDVRALLRRPAQLREQRQWRVRGGFRRAAGARERLLLARPRRGDDCVVSGTLLGFKRVAALGTETGGGSR